MNLFRNQYKADPLKDFPELFSQSIPNENNNLDLFMQNYSNHSY